MTGSHFDENMKHWLEHLKMEEEEKEDTLSWAAESLAALELYADELEEYVTPNVVRVLRANLDLVLNRRNWRAPYRQL